MTKQVIDIGTTANDGTGDPIRTAFIKTNGNFNELFMRMSPLSGTGNNEMMNAVKYFIISQVVPYTYYHISYMKTGVAESGQFRYTVEVNSSIAINAAGTMIMRYTELSALKTGTEIIYLAEANPRNGYWGWMIINWANLTAGAEYTNDNWVEGGLFVLNMTADHYYKKGAATTEITNNITGIDGSQRLYILNPPDDTKTIELADYADIVGDINFKNISAFFMTVTGTDGETFDTGDATIVIEAGKSCTIICYDNDFILSKGEYVAVTPP